MTIPCQLTTSTAVGPTAVGLAAVGLALLACACTDDSCDIYDANCVAANDSETGADDQEQEGGGETCEGETKLTIIDSTNAEAWVRFDLDDCARVDDGAAWDLGFQRFQIALNGGVSGDAGVEGTWIDGVSLAEVDAVPGGAEWSTDEPDADDDGEAELLFIDWYDYDIAAHVLTPKPRVYIVRSTASTYFAIEVLDYYNDAGSSGYVELAWKEIDKP